MIKYHTITIDDYLIPEGSELPDSIEVEIKAHVEQADQETGGGYNVGAINLVFGGYSQNELDVIFPYIDKHEDRLKEILASK